MMMSLLKVLGSCLFLLTPACSFSAIVPRSRGVLTATRRIETRRFSSSPPSPEPGKDETSEDGDKSTDMKKPWVDDSDGEGDVTLSANPLYGYGQIDRILQSPWDKRLSLAEHEARRTKKVQEWEEALSSTKPQWGNRKAISDAPVWATPRVLGGGFVSGRLLAELKDGDVSNEYYLTAPGLEKLDHLLKSGCYRIHFPEHGALLMVAWLLGNDQVDEAKAILEEITPYFHRLRFYPDEADTPLADSCNSSLFISSVGEAKQAVEEAVLAESNVHVSRTRKKIACRNAIQDWLPLKWKLLSLWNETSKDGIPGERFPPGWHKRAESLLEAFSRLAERDQNTNRGRTRNGSTSDMVSCLKKCLVGGTDSLSEDDKLLLQEIVRGNEKKHGTPGSTEFSAFQRHLQASIPPDATLPMKELIGWLSQEDAEKGLSPETIDKMNSKLPKSLHRHVNRTRMGSLEELIEHGMVPSSEALASLFPKLMAEAANGNVKDTNLRHLGYALEVAFSARNSVLLFDLQSQVRFEELPWARPLLQCRNEEDNVTARATLKRVVTNAINSFPQTILPNKLLQSMRTLVDASGVDLPLTDELAADIFMGKFSDKFHKSAHAAAKMLQGSVYERYFGLDYEKVLTVDAPLDFLKSKAGINPVFSVSRRQQVIEQQQILTTHNLAACYLALGLELDGRDLAMKVWDWILTTLCRFSSCDLHSTRHVCKNVGYAWRQLLFFVSIADNTDGIMETLRERKNEVLDQTNGHLVDAFFLQPLEKALNGQKADFVLLGYPSGIHPLLLIVLG